MLVSPTITPGALGADVLPDPFSVDDLRAAGAAVERGREMRRRSDALVARLHRALKQPPPE